MMEHMLFLTGTADTSRQFDLPGDDAEVYTNDPDAVKPVPPSASPETEEVPEATVEEAEEASEEMETIVLAEEEPAPTPNLLPLWISLGVLGGILIGAVAAILCRRLLKRKKKLKISTTKEKNALKPLIPIVQV